MKTDFIPESVNDLDRAYGYDTAAAIANMSGNILVGVASGGAGCWAKDSSSMAAKGVGYGVKFMDIGGNAVGMAKNGYDIYDNGPSLSNIAGVAGNGLGLAGNLKMKCFTAGTQVVIGMEYDADGNFVSYVTMNIEDVQAGDLVYSYNTLTGETELCEVTDTFVRESDHINYLTIVDEHGHEQVIETTDGHPFWVVTNDPDMSRAARDYVFENGLWLYHEDVTPTEHGYWVEAKDLRIGDVFIGANGELSTLINAVRVEQDGGIDVFNFSVEGNHNYYILAKEYEYGQTCILVHNAGLWYPNEVNGRRVYQRDDLFPNTPQNRGLMENGYAPYGFDGQKVQLHHMLQEEPGTLAEISATLHQKVPHNQVTESFRNNPALNASYENFRPEYWKARVKDFEP